MIWQQ